MITSGRRCGGFEEDNGNDAVAIGQLASESFSEKTKMPEPRAKVASLKPQVA
ncbi:MAG: hypothetical protein LH479_02500 [Polaromonas sp.]|nr:hypothetical protein [Polaromonas sp.]